MSKKIKVVLLKPGKLAEIVEIDASLKGLQSAVQGHIETICPFAEEVCLICNEEGKINNMQLNRALYDNEEKVAQANHARGDIIDVIAGPCFICGCAGENFASLTKEQLQKYFDQFKYPEQFYNIGGLLKALPYIPE